MSFFIDQNQHPTSDSSLINIESEGIPNEQKESNPGLQQRSSSLIRFYPYWCTCFNTSGLRYPNETATWRDKLAYFFQCPPNGPLPRILIFLIIFISIYVILYILLGELAGFHGPFLPIVLLEILGLFSGLGLRFLGFPALLAPLSIGIIIRNIDVLDHIIYKTFAYPYNDIQSCNATDRIQLIHRQNNLTNEELIICCSKYELQNTAKWIDPIREIALTLILTRAGLELSPKQLKKLKGVVPMLAFGPCIVEALICALLFYGLFIELDPPFFFCLVAGFALSAVSPAVVVPGVLSLRKRGYGVKKGISTLLIASSSIDDVLAITLYTIFLSIGLSRADVGNTGNSTISKCFTGSEESDQHHSNYAEWIKIVSSLSAVPLGIIHGILIGCFLHFIPSKDSGGKGIQRIVLLLLLNILTMLGYQETEILGGAGSIGVLVTSFVASFGWRSQSHWKKTFHKVESTLGHIWTLFVPILFGTIGKEIRFVTEKNDPYLVPMDQWKEGDENLYNKFWDPFERGNFGRIFGIIIICLIFRSITSFLIAGMAKLNWKERIFVSVAWLPKATVQAALAPIVLTQVLIHAHSIKYMCIAKLIVAMAVVGIIVSAPIGAIAISLTGPKLLKREEDVDATIDEEFPHGDDDEPSIDEGDENQNGLSQHSITQMLADPEVASFQEQPPQQQNTTLSNQQFLKPPPPEIKRIPSLSQPPPPPSQ